MIDALIDKVIFAPTRADVVTATHALDRVLLWNYYTILNYYSGGTPVAIWNKFSRPKVQAKYGVDLLAWWTDPDKVKALKAAGYGAN